ncbi:YceI family protein [Advenella mimigardefordensis]|uniref:YceI-like domain-containing protein n=1 Tax=Advenella mimigardefordensis (strain DSM 17166 / LMG 22922 / DPN7) TaxID=1247726 RepID=W0PC20_ADVMD|nr:YceI family protein [Advenella mimigardefordensis]AHG64251.1 YceI-like domain-containing protein [Advenella mimigardefordensis DPN7]
MTSVLRNVAISAALVCGIAGTAQAETANYEVEPTHTFVTVEVVHFNTSTLRIRFDDIQGTIAADAKQNKGNADIKIVTGSINSGTKAFDDHLKSADFFNAEKYPDITFAGKSFEYKNDKLATVGGDLTLLGQTHPVTLNNTNYNCYFQPVLKKNICGGDFETTIKRSEWGMNWGIDMGVPDEVKILVQIEAIVK